MGKTANSRLSTDLDLTSLVETGDKAKDNTSQPEFAGIFTILFDVLELVSTSSVNLFEQRRGRGRRRKEREREREV